MLMRKALCVTTLIAFALSSGACSNGASVPHTTLVQQTSSSHSTMRRPNRVVEGVIKTDIWAVPEKETWSVGSKGLVVYAKRILIDGVLQAASGSQIALFAPYLRIDGAIASATKPGGLRSNNGYVVDLIDACDFRAGNVNSLDKPTIALPPGDQLYVVASAAECNFTIYGFVSTGPGRKGNLAFPLRRGGEDGGDIEFGTAQAIGVAETIAKNIGETQASAHRPNQLSFDGKIVAGSGGNGADDLAGKFDSKTDVWTFAPTGGGAGGSIEFAPYTLTATALGNFDASAGRGGDGGGIGTANLDGTPEKPDAGGLVIKEASGEQGGFVSVSNAKGQPTTSSGGLGGNAGSISAAAGNGWNTSAGTGGTMRVTLAAPGKGGRNVTNIPALDGGYPTMVFSGGNGGSGAPFYGGGLAGSLYITRPKAAPALTGTSIAITGFNGGPGGSSCGSTGPTGGAGGNLYEIAPTSDYATIVPDGYSASAFTGGAGGVGTSGTGGFAGYFYLNGAKIKAVGTIGNPGRSC
jgi:hypothetical protein